MNTFQINHFNEILDKLKPATIISNEDLVTLYINPTARQIFQNSNQEFEGQTLDSYISLTKDQNQSIGQCYQQDSLLRIDTTHSVNAVESIPCTLYCQSVSPANNSDKLILIEVISDAAVSSMENDFKSLGLILSTIGHDISNPLSILKLQSEMFKMIADRSDTVPKEEVLKRLKTFQSAIEKLSNDLNELKKWSKLINNNDINTVQEKIREHFDTEQD